MGQQGLLSNRTGNAAARPRVLSALGVRSTCTGHAPANLATCRNLVIGTSEQPATPTSPTPEDAKPTVHDRALTPFDL